MRKFISLFFIFLTTNYCYSQIDKLIDSGELYLHKNPLKAQKIAINIINNSKNKAIGLELLGKSKYFLSEYDSAIFYLNKAKNLYQKMHNLKKEAELLEKIGSCYYSGKSEYDKAMQYYLESFQIREEIKDTVGLAYLLNNIGNIYYRQNIRDKARQTYKQALIYAQKTKDEKIYAIILNNLGAEYAYIKSYDTALRYYFKALKIKRELNNPVSLAVTYGSIGSTYKMLGKIDSAQYFFQIALDSLKNKNKYYYALILNKLADTYKQKKQYQQAIKILKKAISIAKEINVLEIQETSYKELSKMYSEIGDYKQAYSQLYKYTQIHDTLFNRQRDKALSELRLKYETEKQQKENELLKKENQIKELKLMKQNIKLRFALAIMTLSIILLFLFYMRFRYKQKIANILEAKNKELAQINKKLTYSEEQLKKEIQTKNKFFSIIGHDLRNPLNALPLVTENLEQNFDKIPDQQKKYYISSINKTVQNLSYLVENLLTWAKAQTESVQIHLNKFSIHNLVEENINLFLLDIEKKKLTIINKIPKNLNLCSDINLINTVIRNLLSNAIKFTLPRGKIIFDIEQTEEKYIIKIQDNGIGISEEEQKKIFLIDVNPKTIGSSSEKGSGLGLIITKEFIKLLDEKIWFKSKPNEGTTFFFTIKKHNNYATKNQNNNC